MSNSIKDALKKLCLKLTGKKSNKESIQDVIDDITDNYEGGGTEVIANPTLSGDEPELAGIEIEGTKYKVPEGGGTEVKIYNHSITINYTNGNLTFVVYLTIPLTTQASLTLNEFKQYIAKAGSSIAATGFYSDGRNTTTAKRFIVDNIVKIVNAYYIRGASESLSEYDKPVYFENIQDITSYLNESRLVYVDSVREA